MKTNRIVCGILGLGILSLSHTSCTVEPAYYSQVVPDTFLTSQEAVWERFNRPFTHWRYFMGTNAALFVLQELGTDELCLPTRGSDWYNGGIYVEHHHHKYHSEMSWIDSGWTLAGQGVALALSAWEDINSVDLSALGFTDADIESMEAQLQTLVACFYIKWLDLFGGVPIYTSTQEGIKARSTDRETFDYIESLLKTYIPKLPVKEVLGEQETNVVHAAAGATLLAQLYFNAESYIDVDMYDEAAEICQDIIDGVYGEYALADDWRDIFGWGNETCPEIIWTIPSQYAKLECDGAMWSYMMHYNYDKYLGGLVDSGADNGWGLTPGLDPEGNPYKYNLGNVYRDFDDKDVRKQNYVYYGNGEYVGQFVVGKLVNPIDETCTCTGNREYKGSVITIVDQCAQFAQVGSTYSSVSELPSTISTAEENSLVRVMKRSPRPSADEYTIMFNPDIPVIRLSEIYYMLAECKMRAGNTADAAELINKVRLRYFGDGVDPDPVTSGNLDKYRMLKEWQQEFLCEARRRTDLIRWGAYVTEDWWDHEATNKTNLNRYPIYDSILGANALLEQNPGY